ncbi:MAG TPA: AIR synthase-related protein, partial [Gaiellaceae bacterium]|nr:AIR synthase-related protein [Gaiellaceae bacterium]
MPVTLDYLTELAEQHLHRALGLTDWEASRIRELLGRDPNHFELAVFSLLWSEHCGYKHSATLLRRLPSSGERVLGGPGGNAGVLDLGDGTAVAFKVESHNHPSAVEPFQGAATGIGGILRDVVAMGARPVALLDGLWFGAPDFHFWRAVEGIGHYGNCVGVPNVGGATVFDPAYAGNCLVNAMCVGLLDAGRLRSAKASGPGRLVVLYGATTGRDGIGGASVLASAELGEDDAGKRPSVQVGDPFTGKKLIEVSLELVESGLVESLQDCGAAGLASALSEMASDGAGLDVHLDRVPLREEGMEPWEIMVSESQERMVAVVRPQMLEAVEAICARWELACTAIGEVTDSGVLRAFDGDDAVGEIPARLLTDECPRYHVDRRAEPRPPRRVERPSFDVGEIVEQYDQLVGSRTVRRPGLDAAVLRLRPSVRGLAVALQGPAPGETDGFRAGVQATLGA